MLDHQIDAEAKAGHGRKRIVKVINLIIMQLFTTGSKHRLNPSSCLWKKYNEIK